MTDVPRRLPPGQTERTRVAITRAAAGSLRGGTRMAKPVPYKVPPSTPYIAPATGGGGPVGRAVYTDSRSAWAGGDVEASTVSSTTGDVSGFTYDGAGPFGAGYKFTTAGYYEMTVTLFVDALNAADVCVVQTNGSQAPLPTSNFVALTANGSPAGLYGFLCTGVFLAAANSYCGFNIQFPDSSATAAIQAGALVTVTAF